MPRITGITKGTSVTVELPAPKEQIRDMFLYVYAPNGQYYNNVDSGTNPSPRTDIRGEDKGVQTQMFDIETINSGQDTLIGLGQGHSRNAMIEVANLGKVNQNDENESFRFKLVSLHGSTRTELTAFTNAIRHIHYTLKS